MSSQRRSKRTSVFLGSDMDRQLTLFSEQTGYSKSATIYACIAVLGGCLDQLRDGPVRASEGVKRVESVNELVDRLILLLSRSEWSVDHSGLADVEQQGEDRHVG